MYLKFKIVHLIEFFLFLVKNLLRVWNLKKRWVDFHKIGNAGTSKLLDVQWNFMFKSECKILSYGHFNIPAQACHARGDGIDREFFVSSLCISVAIKVRFLKCNMFNRYKHNISKLVLVFF